MDKKQKTLIGSDYYLPHWTGIVKGIHNLASRLDMQFTVITVQHNESLLPEELIDNVKILRSKPLFKFSRAAISIAAIASFAREVKNHDCVLINSPCSNILPYSILAKLFRKKLVIFHQGDLTLRQGKLNRIIEIAFWICTYLSCALADVVSSYTEDYAKTSSVLRFFSNKRRAMLMPMLLKPKSATPPESISKMINAKKQGEILIGFAGRFVHEKGFDVLFDAIPNVIKSIPNARFIFAGATQMGYENFFEEIADKYEKVKQHIIMLGLLSEADLWDFYYGIDLCVISSRTDCFPLVQMEACLCGKPSVCTDIPGARYLVKHTGFGEICKKEDPQELARALIKVASNLSSYSGNFQKVKDYLSVDACLKEATLILKPLS